MARSGTLPREVASMVDRLGSWSGVRRVPRVRRCRPGVAQGTLSGELVAADVAGYVVIACFADAELGCDEARSGFAEIGGGGTRAAWPSRGWSAGPSSCWAGATSTATGRPRSTS
jgi:hypothetical protein